MWWRRWWQWKISNKKYEQKCRYDAKAYVRECKFIVSQFLLRIWLVVRIKQRMFGCLPRNYTNCFCDEAELKPTGIFVYGATSVYSTWKKHLFCAGVNNDIFLDTQKVKKKLHKYYRYLKRRWYTSKWAKIWIFFCMNLLGAGVLNIDQETSLLKTHKFTLKSSKHFFSSKLLLITPPC